MGGFIALGAGGATLASLLFFIYWDVQVGTNPKQTEVHKLHLECRQKGGERVTLTAGMVVCAKVELLN